MSSIASRVCAVPLFVPGGRSFVPTYRFTGAPCSGPSRLAVAFGLPLAPGLLGHTLTGLSTAQGLSGLGRCFIGLDTLEGAPIVEHRPADARELAGERCRQ